jgi:uncharacterized heparinase superfamily protein
MFGEGRPRYGKTLEKRAATAGSEVTTSRAAPFAELYRLVRFAAFRALLKLRATLKRPFSSIDEWLTPRPERLLIAPQEIRTADPTVAAEIYAGYYAFGGKIVNAHGQSPFALQSPSSEWGKALNGFSWLRHLRAADTALARANGRSLVKEFIFFLGKPRPHPAWEPEVVARRTLSWLSQSPMLLDGVDFEDYRRFLDALARGYWLLRRQMDRESPGESQLIAATAMTMYALCVQGGASLLKAAVTTLNDQISRQILPDGGTISRNPQTLIDLLLDLLPLRQAFAARGLSPPTELLNAIDRISPALRMFRHGDGSLALFNGMGNTAPDDVAIALAYEDFRCRPVYNARHSGYQRLEARDALVLIDAGAPPPRRFSRSAHAGCLSFEFSFGQDRLIVNCGNPGLRRFDLQGIARTTAAHSTLTLGDASSCIFAAQTGAGHQFGDEIIAGPQNVPVARGDNADSSIISASHDGYARRFGFIHERCWRLGADGGRLQGTDRLIATNPLERRDVNFAVRFHIHPSLTLRQIEGEQILLVTPKGVTLIFEAGGLALNIEASIFFAAPEGPRPCEQIVIYGSSSDVDEINWSFVLLAPEHHAIAVEN